MPQYLNIREYSGTLSFLISYDFSLVSYLSVIVEIAGIHTVFAMLQDLFITVFYEENRPKFIIIYNACDRLKAVLVKTKYLQGSVNYVIIENYLRNMDKNKDILR